MHIAPAAGAFPEMHQHDVFLPPLFEGKGNPTGYGASIPQGRNNGNHTKLYTSQVRGVLTAPRGPVPARQPVAKDLAQGEPANQQGSRVPVTGKDDVTLDQLDRGTYGNRFLPTTDIDTPHDLALTVEHALDAIFGSAGELQVIEHPLQDSRLVQSDPAHSHRCLCLAHQSRRDYQVCPAPEQPADISRRDSVGSELSI